MPAIKLSAFGGMIPAQDDRLLPDNMAADAKNVWLYTGVIEGIRELKPVYTVLSGTTKRVFRIPKAAVDKDHIFDSYWMEFPISDVNVLKAPMDNDGFNRYYWAGDAAASSYPPNYNTLSRIIAGSSSYILGVPAPSVAPVITLSPTQPMTAVASSYSITLNTVALKRTTSTGTTVVELTGEPSGVGASGFDASDIIESRAYVYTWVTTYGEEGPPSPPTLANGHPYDKWKIALTAPTSGDTTDRSLDKVRIYRTVTSSAGIATYFFVAELAIGTTSYSDTIADSVVTGNSQLESTNWTAPPVDLKGIITMPNGMFAGFRENEIWFCEPYHPHAWPSLYTLSVDYKIVGVGVVGQTLVVCTQAAVYAASGINPSSMTLSMINEAEPCMSRASIVSTKAGVAFASPNGLVVAASGTVTNITENLFTKDKWQDAFNLSVLRAATLGSSYYAFGSIAYGCFQDNTFETTAFEFGDFTGSRDGGIIDPDEKRTAFIRLDSEYPTADITNDPLTDELFVLRDGVVYHLDISSSRPRSEYTWKSKRFQMPNKRNLGALKIFFDNPEGHTSLGTIKIYADESLVSTRALSKSGTQMRLPSGFKANFWQIEVTSRVIISSIHMSDTAKDLARV